jgi:dipeptidyl aminopeptidase/acylaminoacyl peptidase
MQALKIQHLERSSRVLLTHLVTAQRAAILLALLGAAFGETAHASPSPQGTAADYARAEALPEVYAGKLKRFRPAIRWTEDLEAVHWRSQDGTFTRVDIATGEPSTSKDASSLGLAPNSGLLEPRGRSARSGRGREATKITFRNEFERPVRLFWVESSGSLRRYGEIEPGAEYSIGTLAGHAWFLDFAKDDLAGAFVAEPWEGVAVLNDASRDAVTAKAEARRGRGPADQSEGQSAAERRYRIRRDGVQNVVGVDSQADEDGEFTLATDGSKKFTYQGQFHWSPDGRYALGFRETVVEDRTIPLVESSPKDQIQPRLETIRYRKPGDELPQRHPRLFDLQERASIPVDASLFRDAWSVRFERWSPGSDRVYVRFHERGHQRIAIRSIDVKTGEIKDVIDERAKTFIDYSQKGWIHWMESADEVLWASERDGWNHLYRIDASTGEVKNQITSGAWVMRKVERVDEEAGQIWFTIMGYHPNQDPYHKHLARVNLDGTGLTVLTDGDGTHEWTLSPDSATFIDRWTRVDQPTITDLRSAETGRLIARLGEDDASDLEAAGYVAPERFTAPGRDGKTPIYGHIIRPSNHDPAQSYPVIESIYAGPHGFHVPKSFGTQSRLRRVADLGFIVVQIDGMGTNWRSKAFHDVAWQNLKDAGFPDRIAWLKGAAAEDPSMDLTRVGIFGGSAGGQNALGALLHHGDFYRAAAADCGCHDNRMDKIWWNEAWMGRMGPHYADSSNVTHASRLQGDLLLTVGELDKNVDPASTLQVVNALIQADKDFEFVIVPGAGHGVGGGPYLFRRRQDFFVRSLWGKEPRTD